MEIKDLLLGNGFTELRGDDDFCCIMRIHEIHYLLWSERLSYFFIGYRTKRKGPVGSFKQWTTMIIPKPIYTILEAETLIKSIT